MKSFKAFQVYVTPKVLSVFFLGISCGLPLSLLGTSLSFWLKESGLTLGAIGLYSLLRTPLSLKFLWAPLVDRIKLPYLSKKLGKRRAWGLLFQIGMMISIFGLSALCPEKNIAALKILGVLTAFFIASQDIVVDALRIETIPAEYQGQGAASYQMGYRLGMLFSGAGGLWLASFLGWNIVYFFIGLAGTIGMATLFLMPFSEEDEQKENLQTPLPCHARASSSDILSEEEKTNPPQRKIPTFLQDLHTIVVSPFKDFMTRYAHWGIILMFIITYKLSNATLGKMAGLFYNQIGFNYTQIAGVSNIWGTLATILGTILGGALVMKKGVMKTLFLLGVIEIFTSVGFAIQAFLGNNIYFLSVLIAFDNIVGGMGTTAFVAYLSGLCSPLYVTTQYALLSSIMALPKDFFASFAGYFVEWLSWPLFFFMTGLLMHPSLWILSFMMKKNVSPLFQKIDTFQNQKE